MSTKTLCDLDRDLDRVVPDVLLHPSTCRYSHYSLREETMTSAPTKADGREVTFKSLFFGRSDPLGRVLYPVHSQSYALRSFGSAIRTATEIIECLAAPPQDHVRSDFEWGREGSSPEWVKRGSEEGG